MAKIRRRMKTIFNGLLIMLAISFPGWTNPAPAGFVNGLRSLGYSLIPAAKNVQLTGNEITVDQSWGIESQPDSGEMAVGRLKEGALELHHLKFEGTGPARIVIRIVPGRVKTGSAATSDEAYFLKIARQRIEITGNNRAGLFYGVQSLLQLLRLKESGAWKLPEAEIEDWPALPLRFIHWDTKHHQDRPETLKRFIDWASFFKVNAIGFEIEDKYVFPRHPVIGAPGAFTKSEMQDLTRYALERHIQLIPQIQAPAHMAYVLKHEEFKRFRADGSNYQASMCDEEALSLIQDIYQDMIDATPGVKYFHASTDEVYFAGICAKCQEKRPYNDKNRSLTWVEYVNRMHKWLAARDRKMLCWVEYPLLEEHLKLLPRGLINGVAASDRSGAWNQGLRDAGVASLIYSSQQGGELLFPNYFSSDFQDNGRPITGRLEEPAKLVPQLLYHTPNDLIGTYAAAWDDSGLHNETFWLGWVMVSQYGWSPNEPRVEQVVADFMDLFYGPGNQDMVEIYRTLMEGARFYESSLDRVPARRLKPTYGSYAGPGRDTTRIDLKIEPPPLPFAYDETLVVDRTFSRRYALVLEKMPEIRRRLDQAIGALAGKLSAVSRNRYNLEVLLSITQFERHYVSMLGNLMEVEELMIRAAEAQNQERYREVIVLLTQAHQRVQSSLSERKTMWAGLKATWEKSRYPKGQSLGGRSFVHILDDMKDHPADRRAGLEYLLEPLENIGLEKWKDGLAHFIRTYAQSRQLAVPELIVAKAHE
jgi:hexosaminidase